ncbi:S1 family peptidase [Pseudochryseolinea flava]|uniref:Serine protease n=1 Tax=Pseudochryseolinea flava TaxID=2059302 RepID=A0A364XWZ5_9BACT|nr:serine protease [Pseudochryseolinea flava]RAV98756.1 serine protease [Pseudochryseolinea flava]
MSERDLIELLDRQSRGDLSHQETIQLEEALKHPEMRAAAEKHGVLLSQLHAYGKRQALHTMMDSLHETIDEQKPKGKRVFLRKAYWPIAGIAASIALISVIFTWSLNQSVQDKMEEYKELRLEVQRIEKSQNAIVKEIKEKEKAIQPSRYSGTGFFISSKGYLVTSYHVVKDADSVYIENGAVGNHKAEVIYLDALSDLALLKVVSDTFEMKTSIPFLIRTAEADLGEEVYTLGFPREDIVFGEGSISALTGYRQNPTAYQISIPVNPGNSGGPLLNSKGDLIGVISGIQTKLTGAAFAVKSTSLYEVVKNDSIHETIPLPRQNTMRGNRVDQVKKWKDLVVMVRVYN